MEGKTPLARRGISGRFSVLTDDPKSRRVLAELCVEFESVEAVETKEA